MAFSNGGAEMNVTPLIDVLLVLIIIFMIIVPVTPVGERALIPRESTDKSRPDPIRTIVVQLRGSQSNATLTINEEAITWDRLQLRLTAIFRDRFEKVAFVKADPALDFEQVARVIDTIHAAGVDNVGLMK